MNGSRARSHALRPSPRVATASAFVCALLVLCAGCRATRCEDLVPEPIAGKYLGGGSLGEERLLRVSLEASPDQIVLNFSRGDGTRIRAKYRIKSKGKLHPSQ